MSRSIRFQVLNKDVLVVQVGWRVRIYTSDIDQPKGFKDLIFRHNPHEDYGTRLAKIGFQNGRDLHVIEVNDNGVIYYNVCIYIKDQFCYGCKYCTCRQIEDIMIEEQNKE